MKFEVFLREKTGSRDARRIRKNDWTVGVIYGKGKDNLPIKLKHSDAIKILKLKANQIIEFEVNKNSEKIKETAVLKDYQIHPVSQRVLHLDFLRTSPEDKVRLKVKIQLCGEALGIKKGGMLEEFIDKLEVEGKIKDIPEILKIDISNLDLGEALYVKDLKFENLKIQEDKNVIICSISKPKVIIEEEKPEVITLKEEAPPQPEVIKKGKKQEEE